MEKENVLPVSPIKWLLAGGLLVFSLITLIIVVLNSLNIISFGTKKTTDIDISTELTNDTSQEVAEDEADTVGGCTEWVDYDYDYVSFSAPCDWELYDDFADTGNEGDPITDIRIKKDDYMIRFHGYFGTTGGGFGNPFDGICSEGRGMSFTNINDMFDRANDYVVYESSNTDPSCSFFLNPADVGNTIWLGSFAVLRSDNHESFEPGVISYNDVFGEYVETGMPSLYSIMLMHMDFIDMPKSSSVRIDDPELIEMQAEYDEIVRTVVLKEIPSL